MTRAVENGARRIVCFGEALIDFLARPTSVVGAPRAFEQYAGGAPANVAVAVARLGGRADFVGMVGADMFGDFLVESLAAAGVGTAGVVRTDAAKTALAFIQLDAQGERQFSFYRPPAADLLFRAEHFGPRCFADAAVFHVCSNSLTEAEIAYATVQGIMRAREAGVLVSFDMNLRPSLWPRGADPLARLWDVLHLSDLVKLSREELEFLAVAAGSAEAVLQRLWQGRARFVVVTDGAAPMRWHTRDAAGEMPGFRVPAIDTTAAGDAFVGGLLFHLVQQGVDAQGLAAFLRDVAGLKQALRFGAAAGALATTRHGAFAAMPARDEVERLLKEQYEHAA